MYKTVINNEKGVSLIEIAIFIGFLGIMMAGVLSLSQFSRDREAIRTTEKRMDVVVRALSAYAQTRWRLPCPVSVDAVIDDVPFGTERLAGTDERVPDCDVDSPEERFGIIPYRTLGIPEHYAKDGWGRYFTYGISPAFTSINKVDAAGNEVHERLAHNLYDITDTASAVKTIDNSKLIGLVPRLKFCGGNDEVSGTDLDVQVVTNERDGSGAIVGKVGSSILQDGTGSNIVASRNNSLTTFTPNSNYSRNEISTAIAMVLISHGDNGDGAFYAEGDGSGFTRKNNDTFKGAEEIANNNDDELILINTEFSRLNDAASGGKFDDIVVALTQDQLYAYGGGGSCEHP